MAAFDKIVLRLFVAYEWMCQPFFNLMSITEFPLWFLAHLSWCVNSFAEFVQFIWKQAQSKMSEGWSFFKLWPVHILAKNFWWTWCRIDTESIYHSNFPQNYPQGILEEDTYMHLDRFCIVVVRKVSLLGHCLLGWAMRPIGLLFWWNVLLFCSFLSISQNHGCSLLGSKASRMC